MLQTSRGLHRAVWRQTEYAVSRQAAYQLRRNTSHKTTPTATASQGETTRQSSKAIATKVPLAGVDVPAADPVNPPERTRPPSLAVPDRDASTSTVSYWFRVGRAYGKFYLTGLKAAWNNHKTCAPMRQELRDFRNRLPPEYAARLEKVDKSIAGNVLCWKESRLQRSDQYSKGTAAPEGQLKELTRSDFQVLVRDRQDFPKLPQFLLLFAIAGEYLPLLVPFVPGMVPRTCHIPKQLQGMRRALEERRKASFEKEGGRSLAIATERTEDGRSEKGPQLDGVAERTGLSVTAIDRIVSNASPSLLLHYSTCLGLHLRLWDRFNIAPPQWLLTRRVRRRFQYLLVDDMLLSQTSGSTAALLDDEVQIACVERGINVLERSANDLRQDLDRWQAIVRGAAPSGAYRIDVALSLPSSRWKELQQ